MKRILVYGMADNRYKGGLETYIMNVYRNIDKSKMTFDFVTDFPTIAYSEEVESCGSKIYKIPAKGKRPVGHIIHLFKLLKNHPEYDTVYFNILNAGAAYSMIIPKLFHKKIIVHCHNNFDDNMKLHNLFKPIVNRFAYKKIACSNLAAEYMFNNPENVTIINNAIDIKPFAFDEVKRNEIRSNLKIDNKKVVIHVGRMAPQKNPFFLLDIIKEMIEIDNDVVLLYVGSGPLEEEVKKYAKDIGIYNNIFFLGARNDVPDLLNASDCFLLPSKYEGFGIVLIEAQANGLQCFTSKDVVPFETNVNGLVKHIDLNETPHYWALEITNALKENINRADYAKLLEGSGFVIDETINELEKTFL